MGKEELLEQIKGGLIVSCQAVPGDPIYAPGMTVKMAECAKWGGAVGIRANSPEDVREIKTATGLPVIGLYKVHRPGTKVYLTPTMKEARAVWEAGADVIALQCTDDQIDGRPACELILEIKREIPEAIVFADIGTVEDAARSIDCGADIVAPTFYSNYENYAFENEEPDFLMLHRLVEYCNTRNTPVIMEGNIYSPKEAMQAIYFGAHAVVVGSAITRPHRTTKRFVNMLHQYQGAWNE